MPTNENAQDPSWPEREDTLVHRTAETRVVRPERPLPPAEPPLLPPEGPPLPPEEDPRGIGYGMLVGIVLLGAIAAAVAALLYLQNDDDEPAPATTTTATTASATVPGVVGLSANDATVALDRAGLETNVVTVPGDPPEGRVIAQEPAAGERAPEGSTVRLNVSDGAAGTEEPNTNTVTVTTPATTTGGSTQPPPAPTPEPPAETQVPDLSASSLRPALQQVSDAGLPAQIRYVPSDEPLGTVLGQHPAAGTTVPETAQVTVTVSDGPGDRPSVTVPDTSGQTVNEALETLRGSGLRLIMLRREVADQEQGGTIVAQTPAAGSRAPENAQVLVYMGAYSG